MKKVTIVRNNCLTNLTYDYCPNTIGDRIIVPITYNRQITMVSVTVTDIIHWKASPKGDVLIIKGTFYIQKNKHIVSRKYVGESRYELITQKKEIEISFF